MTREKIMEDTLASIQKKLSPENISQASSNCCIYRVPESLRMVNEDAYRPLLVSIGPVYYGDSRLEAMQQQKLRYFQYFLNRFNRDKLKCYVNNMTAWEVAARDCYIETIKLNNELSSSSKFIEMLLVDAGFIIELFLRNSNHGYLGNDIIFNKPRMIVEVTRDLRLEENQLPFFILNNLYSIASQTQNNQFSSLAYRFFKRGNEAIPSRITDANNVRHLADLLRECYLPSVRRVQSENTNQEFKFTSSVSELSEAGVKFVASSSSCLLDVRFVGGILEIPKFVVTDDTESLFRNIMVFEQCHYFNDSYIIDYFAFMNCLISTTKDVAILVQSGVMENWLGNNEEVANLFSRIFTQTRLNASNFYYSGVCRDLNAHASTPWNRNVAILKRDYFNHPWASISVIYAIVLFVLTLMQVITGFLQLN